MEAAMPGTACVPAAVKDRARIPGAPGPRLLSPGRRSDPPARRPAPRRRTDHGLRSIAASSNASRPPDYDVFTEVIRVPRARRAWIAATTWLGILLAG